MSCALCFVAMLVRRDRVYGGVSRRCIVLGMAGSGKTTLMQRIALHVQDNQVHKRPYVGVSQARSWSPWLVLGAILWVFIAKN